MESSVGCGLEREGRGGLAERRRGLCRGEGSGELEKRRSDENSLEGRKVFEKLKKMNRGAFKMRE